MLVKIHANLRVTSPEGLTQNGEPRKPYLALRGPGNTSAKVYAGNAGLPMLEALVAILKDESKTSSWVELDGIRPDGRGEFVGFVSDIGVIPADPDEIAWAKALDARVMRASIEAAALGNAAAQGSSSPASGARASSTPRRPVPAPAPVAASSNEDLPF